MKEAMLYEQLPEAAVQCGLCSHACRIADGERGYCRVRRNANGTLYSLVYGRTIAEQVEPIEKRPFFHFHPGSLVYSIGTVGCNFHCAWCQNWRIAQVARRGDRIPGGRRTPRDIVSAAVRAGCGAVAYTYTEPTVFFEFAYDTARLVHEAGLANVCVTNGYMSEKMLETFRPHLDAANVDLKAFREETYRRYIGAHLHPVLETLKRMKSLGIWLEITTLVIPGINDDPPELADAAAFISAELGPETPWHLSRFFPAYELTDVPQTPMATLQQARCIAQKEGLQHVYLGNVSGEENTQCWYCNHLLIRRFGTRVIENNIRRDGSCPGCGRPAVGVGMHSVPANAAVTR